MFQTVLAHLTVKIYKVYKIERNCVLCHGFVLLKNYNIQNCKLGPHLC